jgi:predicted AAA+ superfamily ATPase
LNELKPRTPAEQNEIFEKLLKVGGFPDPFLKGSQTYYNRWAAGHLDLILRQDLLDLEAVRDLKSMEILISLLAERVGTPVSNASLARLLQRDPKTIQRWLEILEDLFVIFRLPPFHKNLARAIKKEPKYYFYDTGRVRAGEAARFENLVACSLLKEVQRLADAEGVRGALYYLKTKEGKEVDFLVHFEESTPWLIEVKLSEPELSKNFKIFENQFKGARKIQLVANLKQERSTAEGHKIVQAARWLSHLDLFSIA